MAAPSFIFDFGNLVHLLKRPKKQGKMECKSADGDKCFILFHSGRVAIGFVRQPLNAKIYAIRIL